jgi:hypothetical protein
MYKATFKVINADVTVGFVFFHIVILIIFVTFIEMMKKLGIMGYGLAKYELALNERKFYSISLPNSTRSNHGGITIITSGVQELPPF